MFVDVLLPLAISGAYSYILPESLIADADLGSRVLVPLGKNKRYTGIVVRRYSEAPSNIDTTQLKAVEELVDKQPLLLTSQINFWRWMAQYYMCYPGEVMKAALPSGLKLESESMLMLSEDVELEAESFDEIEQEILQTIKRKPQPLSELRKTIPKRGVLSAASRLLKRRLIEFSERISQSFSAKSELRIRLSSSYQTEEKIQLFLSNNKRSHRQVAVLLTFLALCEDQATAPISEENARWQKSVKRTELIKKAGENSATALATLIKRGVLERIEVEVERLNTHHQIDEESRQRPLSAAQATAKTEIEKEWEKKDVVLLQGVTSSGKTEVYAKLIQQVLDRGEQVLFLLPEIALTTQITTRLGKIFGSSLGVYHSKFPDAERVEFWQRQLTPAAFPLVLGVRSALFLPFQKLGLIIVDEEHESSYKQQDPAPRYHARDAAIVLASQAGAKVLLGTATPSLETYTNALNGKYGLVKLTQRFGAVNLPHIHVENVAELRRKKQMPTPFSPRLSAETAAAIARGEQAIFFLNRRGYSPVLSCKACGWSPRCQRCDVALTLHQKIGKMVCHYCGTNYDIPKQCPQCEHTDLQDIGAGTEKIASMVSENFPQAIVARMDLDTTRSRTAYERIIADFQQRRSNLLVGTQMVTKGLDFDGVSLVGILNADQMLNQCDFRAHERSFQMITQVAGRAGRREQQGLVILQTRQPELPLIRHIVKADYDAMYRLEMADRNIFRFPPVVRLIAIHLKHRDESIVATAARLMGDYLRPHFADDLLGPSKPAVGFVQMLHLRKLLLKVDTRFSLPSVRATLHAARTTLLSHTRFKAVQCYFDVDPL